MKTLKHTLANFYLCVFVSHIFGLLLNLLIKLNLIPLQQIGGLINIFGYLSVLVPILVLCLFVVLLSVELRKNKIVSFIIAVAMFIGWRLMLSIIYPKYNIFPEKLLYINLTVVIIFSFGFVFLLYKIKRDSVDMK